MKSAHDIFRGLRARARTGILIEGAACLAGTLAGFVVVSYGADRLLHLETVFRAALLIGLCWAIWRVATRRLRTPLAVHLDDDELALAVERTDPGIRQALISAVEFERTLEGREARGQSEIMMRNVVLDAERRLSQIDFVRALDARRVVRFGAGLALALGGTIAFLALVPDSWLWARRNLLLSSTPYPQLTMLAFADVTPGEPLRIAEREDLTIRVQVAGVVPDEVELVARFAGGETAIRTMDRTGDDVFSTTLATLLEDVELVARGGDGETEPLQVRMVPRPRITEVRVTLTPPTYIGTDPVELHEVGGELRVPRGGTLEVTAKSSKPLRRAAFVLGEAARFEAVVADDGGSLRCRFAPEQSGPTRIEVTDIDDLGPAMPPQFLLRVVDDAPPELDLETSGIGSLITANARIPGVLKMRDDFGLGTVSALFRKMDAAPPENGETRPDAEFEPAIVEWAGALQVGATAQDLGVTLDLLPTMVDPDPDSVRNPIHPGHLLSLRFDATDRREPDPQTGSSEVRTFRVVTRDKLYQELRRRQEEQRRELERVLTKVVNARAELAEMLSPTADDPNAARARLRVQTLTRQQSALGKTVQGIAERYGVVLEELLNNRLFEPNVIRGIESRVVSPLIALSLDAFPESTTRTAAFGETGSEDARSSCVDLYDEIAEAIRRVLEQMEQSESLSELVETLRIVIRTEREAQQLLEKLRAEEGAGIFGGPERRKDAPEDDEKK